MGSSSSMAVAGNMDFYVSRERSQRWSSVSGKEGVSPSFQVFGANIEMSTLQVLLTFLQQQLAMMPTRV
jgi:hypothetical protein